MRTNDGVPARAGTKPGAGRQPPPFADGPDADLSARPARRAGAGLADSFDVLAADPFEVPTKVRPQRDWLRRGRPADDADDESSATGRDEAPAQPIPARPCRARPAADAPSLGARNGDGKAGARARAADRPVRKPGTKPRRAGGPKAPRPRLEELVLFADRPPSNAALVGRLLTGVVLLGLLIGGLVVAAQWEPRLLPIRTVVVNGEMHGLSREALQEAIAAHIDGGILTQSLTALKEQVEHLPWIDRVSLRRVWPDRIEVRVSEREAHARWGGNGLVTADGVVFRPRDGRVPAGLALLEAPEDALAPEVVRRFRDWGTRLVSVGLILEEVRRDARGDWTLKLLGGTEVLLGTGDLEARLARLLAAWPQVEAIGVPARLDLRYSNGLAVRWVPIVNSGAAERIAANPDRQRS